MKWILQHMTCYLLISQIVCQAPGGPKCGEGTFSCGDDTCIPSEWLCDKDADCDGGEDEDQQLCAKVEAERFASWSAGHPDSATPTLENEHANTHVVDDFGTLGNTNVDISEHIDAHSHHVGGQGFKPLIDDAEFVDYNAGWGGEEDQDNPPVCSEIHATIVQGCQQHVLDWIAKYGLVDPDQPLFTSTSNIEAMREGCRLYQQFTECLGPLYQEPGACLPEAALNAWDHFEAYTCQLLIPTADNYKSCWDKMKDNQCVNNLPKIEEDQKVANYCNPIFSVQRILKCAESVACDKNTQQVLTAVLSETKVFNGQYNCFPEEIPDAVAGPDGNSCPPPAALQPCVALLVQMSQLNGALAPEALLNSQTPLKLRQLCQGFSALQLCLANANVPPSCLTAGPGVESLPYYSAVFGVLCQPNQLEGMLANQACIQRVEQSGGLADCQSANSGEVSATVPDACTGIDNMVKIFDCALPVIDQQCSVSSVNYFNSLQGSFADQSIDLDCFSRNLEDQLKSGFILHPKHPQCSDDQETSALGCLLSLLELAEVFQNMGDKSLLLEISAKDSPLINKVCTLYGEYTECLQSDVFYGTRCSFTAPLNSMARVGLDPFCNAATQSDMQDNRECMLKLEGSPALRQCSARLDELGPLIQEIVEGGGPEMLCRIFYMIREIFACLRAPIANECSEKAVAAMERAKDKITTLGVEEGCPADEPEDFYLLFTPPPQIIAPITAGGPAPVSPTRPVVQNYDPVCLQNLQQCLTPMLAYQPHPIAVLDSPKDVEAACQAYSELKSCKARLACAAQHLPNSIEFMFDFICNDPAVMASVKEDGKCMRRLAGRADVRACVEDAMNTTKSQAIGACRSAQNLVSCGLDHILEKCGEDAAKLSFNFAQRMSSGVDPNCQLNKEKTKPPASGFNCSPDENQAITACSSELVDITNRVKALFDEGLTKFLGNRKQLTEIFTEGCGISDRFQACVKPKTSSGSCRVSSCLVKAGDGICNQTDKGDVIQGHLKCVFSMLTDKRFARCLASSFKGVDIKDLNAVQKVLPNFINCIEEPLKEKCGVIPVNILRSFASDPEKCILSLNGLSPALISAPEPEPEPEPIKPVIIADILNHPEPETVHIDHVQVVPSQPHLSQECDDRMKTVIRNCKKGLVFDWQPISVLKYPEEISRICSGYGPVSVCLKKSGAQQCIDPLERGVLTALGSVCGRQRSEMQLHGQCITQVLAQGPGALCLQPILQLEEEIIQDQLCERLVEATNCAARHINRKCHEDAAQLVFALMNDFLGPVDPSCQLNVPVFLASSGCTAAEMGYYQQCQNTVDYYVPQPFSFIKESASFEPFCTAYNNQYLPCTTALNCLPEPLVSAQKTLYDYLCNAPLTRALYKKHGQCLADYASSDDGQECMIPWADMTFYGPEAGESVCSTVDAVLKCASPEISRRCGFDALLFVHDLHSLFAQQFKLDCAIMPDDPETYPQSHPEPHPESHPEPHPESHPEPHPETHPESHPEPHPESHPEPHPEVHPEPETPLVIADLPTLPPPIEKTTPAKKPPTHVDAASSQTDTSAASVRTFSSTILCLIPFLLALVLRV